MKKLLLLFILFSAFTKLYAQSVPDTRTPEKKEQDRKEMEAFKKEYPQLFRFNRAPFILRDSGAVIEGYVSSIEIRNNYVVDSVHSNFHPDMPDTTTVIPHSSIQVAGPRVTVSFFNTHFMPIWGSADITPADSIQIRADSVYKRIHITPVRPAGSDKTLQYFRISLNRIRLLNQMQGEAPIELAGPESPGTTFTFIFKNWLL